MKKLLLVSLVLVTLLVGCESNQTKNEIKYVETTEIMKKLDNKESFIMVVGNTTCAACIAYKPTLEQLVQNKGTELYYVEVDVEGAKSETHRENVRKLFEEYMDDKVNATPSTIRFKDGELVDLHVGLLKYTELIEWIDD